MTRPARKTAGVYPRVCGGTARAATRAAASAGLSPRVRGNRVEGSQIADTGGSIPACAGEPLRSPPRKRRGRVYPRVCGGTAIRRRGVAPAEGLSPRVRGNPRYARIRGGSRRSIPACAGEPASRSTTSPLPAVYPRVCGGTGSTPTRFRWKSGLSPRVRGNQVPIYVQQMEFRSIPACAGEPGIAWNNGSPITVYPRVCGGTVRYMVEQAGLDGLSPRVRGNHHRPSARTVGIGSIPACAGEPIEFVVCHGHSPVYPRVCGGTYSRTT